MVLSVGVAINSSNRITRGRCWSNTPISPSRWGGCLHPYPTLPAPQHMARRERAGELAAHDDPCLSKLFIRRCPLSFSASQRSSTSLGEDYPLLRCCSSFTAVRCPPSFSASRRSPTIPGGYERDSGRGQRGSKRPRRCISRSK